MIELAFIIVALLILLSVTASKISDRFGIPSLLLFMLVGMLAGSEGIGGIYFDDPNVAQAVGVVALVIILFSGGLDTQWQKVKTVVFESAVMATVGVFLTALLLGFIVKYVLGLSFIEGFLIGSITSSTDAAAVFAILRSKGVKLKNHISALLELESGSNDPMAVFLTMGLITLIQNPDSSYINLLLYFFQQMGIGLLCGLCTGWLISFLVKRIHLETEGLYSVFLLAMVLLTYGITNLLFGSGFLAVYVAGIILSNTNYLMKEKISHFFDGLAWLMQVIMFLTLGLFVFPSRLISIAIPSIIISLALMILARPISVGLCTMPFRLKKKEKIFVAWVGLRGAVPIILAIYPKIAGLPQGEMIFNLIFFVVLSSILIQGTSISWTAKKLGVEDDQ